MHVGPDVAYLPHAKCRLRLGVFWTQNMLARACSCVYTDALADLAAARALFTPWRRPWSSARILVYAPTLACMYRIALAQTTLIPVPSNIPDPAIASRSLRRRHIRSIILSSRAGTKRASYQASGGWSPRAVLAQVTPFAR